MEFLSRRCRPHLFCCLQVAAPVLLLPTTQGGDLSSLSPGPLPHDIKTSRVGMPWRGDGFYLYGVTERCEMVLLDSKETKDG